MKNRRGFTLIEILAVIIILGVIMTVAITGVSSYILNSKKEAYIVSARQYVTNAKMNLNTFVYSFKDLDTTYYVHINNLMEEKKSDSPFGKWIDAYVVVTFNGKTHDFYWVSVDETGNRVNLTKSDELNKDKVASSENLIVNNRVPVGNRNLIHIIDKDGNVQKTTQAIDLTIIEADECYSYTLNPDGTIMITYYNPSCTKEVVIPRTIDGRVVTKIYTYSFHNRQLTSVLFPDSITEIGSAAFSSNKLTEVKLPNSIITVAEQAFQSNKITKTYFPEGLKTLARAAFRLNNISSFTLPNSITTIGSCAFCDNPIPNPSFLYAKKNGADDYTKVIGYIGDLTEFPDKRFIIPAEVNGVALQTIGSSAFTRMSLTNWEVVVPDTVTTIESSAFAYSGISKVNLSSNLKTIGSSAFYSNRLADVSIPSSVTSLGALAFQTNYATTGELFIYKRTSTGIDYSTIVGYSGKNRANIIIPSNAPDGTPLVTIGDGAFKYLSLTGGVTIPASVKNIGTQAFLLNNLTYIDNGDGNKTRGAFLFSRNANGSINYASLLQYAGQGPHVDIPAGVTRIENYALHYSHIKTVNIPEGVTYIGTSAFGVCRLIGTVTIPSTVTTIGSGAFKKEKSWDNMNGDLTKIVNKTGRAFNWTAITNSVAPTGNFVTGTLDNWYGDIEITNQ